MNLFLDTNAVVMLYHDEAGTDVLTRYLLSFSDSLIVTVSELTLVEFRSACLRKVRTGEIEHALVRKAFDSFEADLELFHITGITGKTSEFAIHLLDVYAPERSLRTLDAIQLASAIVSNQYIPVDCFVSADTRLLTVAADFFESFNPLE